MSKKLLRACPLCGHNAMRTQDFRKPTRPALSGGLVYHDLPMATCSNMVAGCRNSLISVPHADWQANDGDLTAPDMPQERTKPA